MKKMKSEKNNKMFMHIVDLVIGAVLGAVISAVLIGNYLWSAFFAVFVIAIIIIYGIFLFRGSKNRDIYRIIQNELKNSNYLQVIRIGYTLSRALHLGGNYQLRYDIGQLTDKACNQIDNDKSVRINDKEYSIKYIKAKNLIDDLGWTAHLLGFNDIAINNINDGINIISTLVIELESSSNGIIDEELYKIFKKLEIKGYRHLIGILNDNQDKITKAKELIKNNIYKSIFSADEQKHNEAELNYSIARAIINDNPDEALKLAKEAKRLFQDDKTPDMDRYVKTFDLIGDIYATYGVEKKLLSAESAYKEGLRLCRQYGRSERFVRISIDYINLFIKMIDIPEMYNKLSWKEVDDKETELYKNAKLYADNMENKEFLQRLKNSHKKYYQRRKHMKS